MLKIVSYNCRGLPRSAKTLHHRPSVNTIMNKDVDILCLQETWYSKQDLSCLNMLHEDFHGIGASTVDYSDGLRRGHNPGGVAILWRNAYDKYLTPLALDLKWLTV